MSLENDLKRIADALEVIASTLTSQKDVSVKKVEEVPEVEPVKAEPKKEKKAKKEEPVVEEVKVVVNKDAVEGLLRKHAQILGAKTTIALMIKHGADKTTPKIATIPEANYAAVIEEATADLNKVEKK
jgi:hypothetical protein